MSLLHLDYDDMVSALKRQGEHYAAYRSRIPEGKKGLWSVEKFEVKVDLTNFRMIRDGRGCSPGIFTKLRHESRGTIMSDTDAEIQDFLSFVNHATNSVLVGGLGLGLVTQALLNKGVTDLTVIELEQDVIDLVGPHLDIPKDTRFSVIKADIFDWKPSRGKRWAYAWFDIWDNICGDNYKQMKELKKKFRNKAIVKTCWCEHECKERDY